MAALYACTKCHQRFPFEALSQGQQLCKVRGLGRRPGAGATPGAARNSRSCVDARRGPLGQGVAGPLRRGAAPGWSGIAGHVGEPGVESRPWQRRVPVLSNGGVFFSDPVRSREGTESLLFVSDWPPARSPFDRLLSCCDRPGYRMRAQGPPCPA